jgi:hypothetical protein
MTRLEKVATLHVGRRERPTGQDLTFLINVKSKTTKRLRSNGWR